MEAAKPISSPQPSLWPWGLGLVLGFPLAGLFLLGVHPIYEWYGQALQVPFHPSWSPSSWTWPGVHVVETLRTHHGAQPWTAQDGDVLHMFMTMVLAACAFAINALTLALPLHLFTRLMNAVLTALKKRAD